MDLSNQFKKQLDLYEVNHNILDLRLNLFQPLVF